MKNRQIRIIAVLLATVLAYAGLIGVAAVTAQAADNAPVVQPVTAQTCVDTATCSDLFHLLLITTKYNTARTTIRAS